MPPVARREELGFPQVETPASPHSGAPSAEAAPTSKSPAPAIAHATTPAAVRALRKSSAARFTAGLFQTLEVPPAEIEAEPEGDEITPDGSLVIGDNETIELTSDLNASLGIGPGQLSWAGSGGFAAYGFDRTVRLGGSTAPVIWGGTKHFVGAGGVLIFGAEKSDATLIWDTKIDLGGGVRTIRLIEGLGDHYRAVVRFDQGFINGDLVFENSEDIGRNSAPFHIGRADLSAANDDWQGNLTVRGIDVHANADATLAKLNSITIERSGRFVVDNLGTSSESWGGHYLKNRLSQFTTITLNSGTLAYWGREWGNSAERTGIIDLLGGTNTIDINGGANQATVLTIGGLHRDTGATLNLVSSNSFGGGFGTGGNTPQLKFRDQAGPWAMPDLDSGIIPWATVNGTDFATLKGKHLVAYTAYNVGNAHTWNATTNASPNADQYLTTDHIVNSLRLTAGRKITLYGNTKLTLNAGALLSTADLRFTLIEGGNLAVGGSGPRELYVHGHGGGFTLINSNISQSVNGAPISLTKTGKGALSFGGHDLSALTGTHHINDGSIWIRQNPRGIGMGGHFIVGNGGLNYATLLLTTTNAVQRSTRITLSGATILLPKTWQRGPVRFSTSSLQVISGSDHYLESLSIEGSGVLHFGGPAVGKSLIALEHLIMTDSSQLFVAQWRDSQTRFLISRSAGDEIAKYLDQIQFVNFVSGETSAAKLIGYNSEYFEIVATGFGGAPEPAATGAILGAGALGFFAWRKRRVANK